MISLRDFNFRGSLEEHLVKLTAEVLQGIANVPRDSSGGSWEYAVLDYIRTCVALDNFNYYTGERILATEYIRCRVHYSPAFAEIAEAYVTEVLGGCSSVVL